MVSRDSFFFPLLFFINVMCGVEHSGHPVMWSGRHVLGTIVQKSVFLFCNAQFFVFRRLAILLSGSSPGPCLHRENKNSTPMNTLWLQPTATASTIHLTSFYISRLHFFATGMLQLEKCSSLFADKMSFTVLKWHRCYCQVVFDLEHLWTLRWKNR